MTTIITEIKHVENHFEVLNSIELNLEKILVEEFEAGLCHDLMNGF